MTSQKSRATEKKTVKAPSRKRGRERVAALLEAAADVFATEGYDGATMTEIAARAGASIGSLYQFFPKKQHIAAELHQRLLAEMATMLDALGDKCHGVSRAEMTDRLFVEIGTFFDRHPAFITLAERRDIDPKIKKQARARLRGLLGDILANTTPPVPEERRLALAAVVLHVIRLAGNLRADDDPLIRETALTEVKAMLRGHLAHIDA